MVFLLADLDSLLFFSVTLFGLAINVILDDLEKFFPFVRIVVLLQITVFLLLWFDPVAATRLFPFYHPF